MSHENVDLSLYTPPRRFGLMAAMRRWQNGERGMQEIAATIFTLPLVFTLMTLIIEVGLYTSVKGQIDSVVQTTVRGVALDGGDYNDARASLCQTANCNRFWSTLMKRRVDTICGNGTRCLVTAFKCSPTAVNTAGYPVSCYVTITYKPVISAMKNRAASLGFSDYFAKPYTSKANSATLGY